MSAMQRRVPCCLQIAGNLAKPAAHRLRSQDFTTLELLIALWPHITRSKAGNPATGCGRTTAVKRAKA